MGLSYEDRQGPGYVRLVKQLEELWFDRKCAVKCLECLNQGS